MRLNASSGSPRESESSASLHSFACCQSDILSSHDFVSGDALAPRGRCQTICCPSYAASSTPTRKAPRAWRASVAMPQQRRSSTRLAGKGLRASRRLAYLSQGRARVRPSASPPPFQRSLETVEARSRHREILEILLDDDVVNEKEIRHVGEAEPDLGHRQRRHLSREAELDENKCSNAYPIRDEYTVPIQLEFTWLPYVPEPEADGVRLARDGWEHLGNETECWWPKRGTKVATVGGDGCDTREGKISRLNPGGKSAGLEAAVGHQV